jgi:hypothetical protein
LTLPNDLCRPVASIAITLRLLGFNFVLSTSY